MYHSTLRTDFEGICRYVWGRVTGGSFNHTARMPFVGGRNVLPYKGSPPWSSSPKRTSLIHKLYDVHRVHFDYLV